MARSQQVPLDFPVLSSTPATPAANVVRIYARSSDEHLVQLDDTGTVTDLANPAVTIYHTIPAAGLYFATSAFPQLLRIDGTNFPVYVLAFDPSAVESAYVDFEAIRYSSGNLTCRVEWLADTATSNSVVWSAAIAAVTADTDSAAVTGKAFATSNTVTDTHLGTNARRLHAATITITNLDSLAVSDDVTLRISREATNGSDTMSGDAWLRRVVLSYAGA